MINLKSFKIDPTTKLLQKRGVQKGGRVQQVIDSEVLRKNSPYVPFDRGVLEASGTRSTVIGQGEVLYRTPYARRMYYGEHYNFQGAPQRGAKWFERMKVKHKQEILRTAAKEAGAKGE